MAYLHISSIYSYVFTRQLKKAVKNHPLQSIIQVSWSKMKSATLIFLKKMQLRKYMKVKSIISALMNAAKNSWKQNKVKNNQTYNSVTYHIKLRRKVPHINSNR